MTRHELEETLDDLRMYDADDAATRFECGLITYYDYDDRLGAILFDPTHGPQPALAGTPLAGSPPQAMTRWLGEYTTAHGLGPATVGPHDDPAHPGLGLALNPSAYQDVVLTRPVLVAAPWAGRLVPDGGDAEVPQWRRLEPMLLRGDSVGGDRVDWDFEPGQQVGPLEFGMSEAAVLTRLGEPAVAERRPAEPDRPRAGSWIRFTEPAVTTCFDEHGRLAAVVIDAARGPQVRLAGITLTGEVPSEVTLRLERHLRAVGHEIVPDYTGNVSSPADGLVYQGQRIGDTLRTRPVLLSADGAGRPRNWRDLPFLADEVHGARHPAR